MKNLVYPNLNYSYFIKIVQSKNDPVRNQLLGIKGEVKRQYRSFVNRSRQGELSHFQASAFNGVEATNLKACYQPISEVSNLKAYIRKRQPAHIRYECQYCMIGDSGDSFDHYLPKEYFPEFSVLSNNLIPCCARCNTLKGDSWRDANGSRNILNLYHDQVQHHQFLGCVINFKKGTPIATFTVSNLEGIDGALYDIIERHFSRLDLKNRFSKKCNSEIVNVINTSKQLVGIIDRNQIRNIMLRDSTEMKQHFGNNYWRATLKEALATSDQFLTLVGFA